MEHTTSSTSVDATTGVEPFSKVGASSGSLRFPTIGIAIDPVPFDELYTDADGDAAQIPWARLAPHPLLKSWAGALDGGVAGLRTLVVGAGLGDDAGWLAEQGAIVTAFDLSPKAVAWASSRFPDIAFHVGDLLRPDPAWRQAFELVVEVRTIQSLRPAVRAPAAANVGAMVSPGGLLVLIAHMATSDAAAARIEGPPWPLAPAELADVRATGLDRLALDHPSTPEEVMEIVATFTRPS